MASGKGGSKAPNPKKSKMFQSHPMNNILKVLMEEAFKSFKP
jgi:hypothetical protein